MHEKLESVESPDFDWAPLPIDQVKSLVGLGLHEGLWKGTDAPGADALLDTIHANEDVWQAALWYLVNGLNDAGMTICRKEGNR